ncbi:MAG: Re/Si-specific NAD(P)(+) transhydrogenase subunit alpha [Gammaproteobacteria bacterium]|nr:Re/Si-specific NAD(P)(+) transhydrogenase subunit alpha [Gammaproteobacteria bacterium]
MNIVVPKELHLGEKRVATTPAIIAKLKALGFSVSIEAGAGELASFTDDAYREAGAEVVADRNQLWSSADIVFKVRAPARHAEPAVDEIALLPEGCTLISFIWPAQNEDLLKQLAERKVTVLAMDSVPRISRSQKLDALSSMANISGYRAVIEAANHFGRFFTGQITAAGRVQPAKVMVIGAGVAGLSAIGTAKSLGAIVRAFDTRPEVKEQIESMDAEFLELEFEEDGSGQGGYAKVMSKEFIDAEMALFAEQAEEVDIIITTALIPGRPAPKLITAEMVKSMKQGSVIVDLAAEQGGNCELTEPGKVAQVHGVSIIGYSDLPSRLPAQSSQLYASNIHHLMEELSPEKNGELVMNMDDVVIRGTTVVHAGDIIWPAPPLPVTAPQPVKAEPVVEVVAEVEPSAFSKAIKASVPLVIAAALLLGLGSVAPASFMAHFSIFVLACVVGYMVVWNVTPSLHTPLMSVTNAISSIIVLGALVQVSSTAGSISIIAGFAIFIATINIMGGFAVTQRMLNMFQN